MYFSTSRWFSDLIPRATARLTITKSTCSRSSSVNAKSDHTDDCGSTRIVPTVADVSISNLVDAQDDATLARQPRQSLSKLPSTLNGRTPAFSCPRSYSPAPVNADAARPINREPPARRARPPGVCRPARSDGPSCVRAGVGFAVEVQLDVWDCAGGLPVGLSI